jgi:glycerol uptake facilitator-like aquaporin
MLFTEAEGGSLRTLEILTFIFVLGVLGLSWPLLEIFRSELVAYLFIFWLVFIISVAFIDFKTTHYKKP